jgi:hypothetical protein
MLITMETTLSDATVEEFLVVYRESFAELDDKAAARQSLTDDEFREEMHTERVLKFVAWDSAARPVALAFVATDLEVVPWISPQYYALRYPEHFARSVIFYFGALLVRPGHRGGVISYALLKELTRFVAANGGIAAFDCCQFNDDAVGLPELIGAVASEVCEVDRQEIDAQRYYAYVAGDMRAGYGTEPLPSIRAIDVDAAREADTFIDLVALEEAERAGRAVPAEEEKAADRDPLHSNGGSSR